MGQVRYATTGAAVAKAKTLAGKNIERDVIVIAESQTHMIAATGRSCSWWK